jgi:hypothetical protein
MNVYEINNLVKNLKGKPAAPSQTPLSMLFRDVHRGVAQVNRATAHMPSSTHVTLPKKK